MDPPHDFQQDFTAEVSTRTHHFPPNSQTDLLNFQWLVTSGLPLITQGVWIPKTQRVLGEHVGKAWPGATSAGHSHLWSQRLGLQEGAQLTQTSSCVPMTTKVSCSSPSHFWRKKRHRSDEGKSKSPNGLCWAWADFSCHCWHCSPQACCEAMTHGFEQEDEWDSNASSQIQTVLVFSALSHFEVKDTQSTYHSYRSY